MKQDVKAMPAQIKPEDDPSLRTIYAESVTLVEGETEFYLCFFQTRPESATDTYIPATCVARIVLNGWAFATFAELVGSSYEKLKAKIGIAGPPKGPMQ